MTVDIKRLRAVTDRLFEYLLTSGITTIELKSDYYWQIDSNLRYDTYDEPTSFSMGQLSEDLQFVEQIESGERPPSAYGLVWLSSLLRYIGEQVIE
jgi:hypothetical protein